MKLQDRAMKCLCISLALIVLAGVLSLFGLGINQGIDFAGGISIVYKMGSAFDNADVETALKNAGVSEFQIAKAGADQSELQIRVCGWNVYWKDLSSAEQDAYIARAENAAG